jgi:hypothetical protein
MKNSKALGFPGLEMVSAFCKTRRPEGLGVNATSHGKLGNRKRPFDRRLDKFMLGDCE